MTQILRDLFLCNHWENCMRLFSLNHRHLNLGEIRSTGGKDVVEGPLKLGNSFWNWETPSETGKFPLKLVNSLWNSLTPSLGQGQLSVEVTCVPDTLNKQDGAHNLYLMCLYFIKNAHYCWFYHLLWEKSVQVFWFPEHPAALSWVSLGCSEILLVIIQHMTL